MADTAAAAPVQTAAAAGAAADAGGGDGGRAPRLPFLRDPGDLRALRLLLAGREVALLWDLDNVDFFSPARTAPLQLRRLQALVAAAGGRLALCRAYANVDTLRRTAAVLPALRACGLQVRGVQVRPDAADRALVQDAVAFGATHGSAAAILCVTQDTGFASALRHLSEQGVRTLAVSPHRPSRRTHEVMEPATYFSRLPLPRACWAALKWERAGAAAGADEARWLAACAAGGSSGDHGGERDDVAAVGPVCDDVALEALRGGEGERVVAAGGREGAGDGGDGGGRRLVAPGTLTRVWLNPLYCGG